MKLTKTQTTSAKSDLFGGLLIAVIVTVFCLVGSQALFKKAVYQAKVINARDTSAKQMKADLSSANTLVTQYKEVFIGNSASNIIGGNNDPSPTAVPPNGDNGKIVLDALPTVYDFPALLTSVSKILTNDGIGNQSIGGTDQSTTANSTPSGNPQPANIDLTVSGTGAYKDTAKLIGDFERSIRPFDITHLTLTGNDASLTVDISLSTYYQPAKTLSITSKEIR